MRRRCFFTLTEAGCLGQEGRVLNHSTGTTFVVKKNKAPVGPVGPSSHWLAPSRGKLPRCTVVVASPLRCVRCGEPVRCGCVVSRGWHSRGELSSETAPWASEYGIRRFPVIHTSEMVRTCVGVRPHWRPVGVQRRDSDAYGWLGLLQVVALGTVRIAARSIYLFR